jgi:hypothetical protein
MWTSYVRVTTIYRILRRSGSRHKHNQGVPHAVGVSAFWWPSGDPWSPPRQIFRWHRGAPDWPLGWQCGHPKSHPAANSALEGLHGRHIARAGHVGRSCFQQRSDGLANVVMPALGPHHHWRRSEEDPSRHDGRFVGGVQAVLPDAAGVTRPTLRSRALRALRPRPRRLRQLTQHPCSGPHPTLPPAQRPSSAPCADKQTVHGRSQGIGSFFVRSHKLHRA